MATLKSTTVDDSTSAVLHLESADTTVTAGESIGVIEFEGNDASASANGIRASINAIAIDSLGATGLAFSTADASVAVSEKARITGDGLLLVGHTASIPSSVDHSIQVNGTTGGGAGISVIRWNATAGAPARLTLGHSGGATIGDFTVVPSGSDIGQIAFAGSDGTDIATNAAAIVCELDGTPGANDMPGRLVFRTTADAAATTTERMRIRSNGRVLIGTTTDGGQLLQVAGTGRYDGTVTVNNAGGTDAVYSETGIDKSSASSETFNIQNSGAGPMTIQQDGTAVMLTGKQTVPYLASAMFARNTSGAGSGSTELSTNKVMLKTLDFDATTAEYAQFYCPMPKSWDEGTVTAKFFWTAASGSGGVAWRISGCAYSDDDALDAAQGTQITVTDTFITANDMHITSETSAITIGGTPVEGDFVIFEVSRDPANGSDTLAVDAKLIAVHIYITYNVGNDA
jgi:hypothetical protein